MKKVLFVLLSIFLFNSVHGITSSFPGESVYHLNDEWKNEDGKTFRLADFAGKPTLFAMVYTTCQHTCPMITSKVQAVQMELPKKMRQKINFALISFDPETDTPEILNKYKIKRKLGSEWSLLTGTDSGARKLAAVIGVSYKKEKEGVYSHSNVLTLIDKNGVVVEQIKDLGQETKKMVSKIEKLLKEK